MAGADTSSGTGTASFQASDYALEDDKIPENGISLIDDEMVDVGEFDKLVHGAVDNVEVVDNSSLRMISTEIEGPIIKIVNGILIRAIKLGASDIHFEPYEKMLRVRLPNRRSDAERDDAPHPDQECRHLPSENHGKTGHCRKTITPGRKDQAEIGKGKGDGFPRFDRSRPLWGKGGPSSPGQIGPAARYDQTGV